jgi:hypothetical protein
MQSYNSNSRNTSAVLAAAAIQHFKASAIFESEFLQQQFILTIESIGEGFRQELQLEETVSICAPTLRDSGALTAQYILRSIWRYILSYIRTYALLLLNSDMGGQA